MTCPSCGAPVTPTPVVDDLTVCQTCARSLVLEGDAARLATAEDMRALTHAQVKELRLARPAAWRNDVRARHAQIVSR